MTNQPTSAILSQMKILGIETSCDESAAAVVEDGQHVLSSVMASQIEIHTPYGGVVPEVAARNHIETILPVIQEAMRVAGTGWDDIDAIAVTYGPGLLGSLLIGALAARTLALVKAKPLYAVDHVEGHAYANYLSPATTPTFPYLALIVSGGHTQLVLFRDHDDYTLLGQTIDDAVGEAFDKVAKVLGLPYPGGPEISRLALSGNNRAFIFPKAKTANVYDFSYSGLKTAVLRKAQELAGGDFRTPSFEVHEKLTNQQIADLAASFQRAAVAALVDKTVKAYREFNPKSVVIGGGVAANQLLRDELTKHLPIKVSFTDPQYCTDNAAMIASLGYYKALAKEKVDPHKLQVDSTLGM